jgi:TolB-like protein
MSGDPDRQYFSDGITEDIITELSRWRQLQVISRHASFQYRGGSLDLRRIGRELGVDYIVEGSVRRIGERIRVTAQLVDAASATHLWAERYDRDLKDLFAVQDEVVQTIVGTLVGRVQAAGAEQAKRKPPSNLAAYECVLRGDSLPIGDDKAEAEARRLYEKAIELDPTYARAYALLALSACVEWFKDASCSDAALDRALELARKAVELDANDSFCWASLGWVYLQRKTFDLAETYLQSALEMNPNNAVHVALYGDLLTYRGRPDDAIEWYDQARRIDRFRPTWHWRHLGVALFAARRYDDAIAAFDRSPIKPFWVHAYVAACHAQSGRSELARKSTAEVVRLRPDFSLTTLSRKEPYKLQSDVEHLLEGLRKAGLPE